jgi:uncharacterized low-complexity protein
MSRFNTRNSVGLLGLALTGLTLSASAFAMQPLAQGYVVSASKVAAEGKCGEGKCGDASFTKTDASSDGFISKAEFVAAAPDRAAEFAALDASGDGKVSEKEAYDYLKATFEAHGKPMPAGLFAKQGK